MTSPKPFEDNDDFGFDVEEANNDWQSRAIDMEDYAKSDEAQEASWWDLAKDVIVQPALGAAQAFTWPADVLKIGMIGEGLSDIDELEDAFKKAGKPFDRDEYIKEVAKTSQYVPTQQLLEDTIAEKTGFDLAPKSETGKWIRKLFFLRQMASGSGLGKSFAAGATGATTTSALKAAGANETASELVGDVFGGGVAALKKSPRTLTPEIAALEQTAAKHGLPFPEYLTREAGELVAPKISEGRRAALTKELGMDSQQAIEKVIEGNLSAAQMRKAGQNLEIVYSDAYDAAEALAAANPKPISTKNFISSIDGEIARIKKQAPQPSDADKASIRVLEEQKKAFQSNEANAQQLIKQIRKNNSNSSIIYKKPEFSGVEEEVKNAYGFLNNEIRNTLQTEADPAIRHILGAGDKVFSETMKLKRVEGLVSKAFVNGDYNPKKLSQLLNSSQGNIVRRELGDKAVSEIKDIARYGEQAVKATSQLAKSQNHFAQIAEWGPLAGMVLHKMPKTAGILFAALPLMNRVRGYLLTNPATREIYRDIVKNGASGSIKNMGKDFAKLESAIAEDYGSVPEFFDSMMEELEFYDPEND